ncbi:MAG: ParB/RepB/Spo0J family partition protein [Pseudomonadota bacterium]
MTKDRKRGLGRGLSALMADVTEAETAAADGSGGVQTLPIERIAPNPEQPRKSFTEEELADLSRSIAAKGVIQPLIVRQVGDGYQIVAGERRWRAAQMAQLHELPVVVRDFSDIEVFEIAIVENVQRENLNPIEEALAYRKLMDRYGHTPTQLTQALGKSRSHIANSVRLLQLPDDVVDMVREGQLSAGHARALITADDPSALARQVVAKGLSVRETEALGKPKNAARKAAAAPADKDADTKALEADLSAGLALKVVLNHKPGAEAGQMVIHYTSLEELDDLCRKLSVQ